MVVGFIWNSRGLNRDDKLSRVGDLFRDHRPDFIGLSETKENFTPEQLKKLDPFEIYMWKWLPAKKTAGGVLLGINTDVFYVLSWGIHTYCVSCLIRKKRDDVVWRFITVYGPSYEEHKLDFINELHNLLAGWSGPTVVGGDFNLVRDSSEKSTGNISQKWANLFNDWVNKFGLIELKNSGRKYTWANNQDNLVMAILDRVFITTCWDNLFPASLVKALARLGSDHTPLVLDTGALPIPRTKQYRFEKWWIHQDGFCQVVEKV